MRCLSCLCNCSNLVSRLVLCLENSSLIYYLEFFLKRVLGRFLVCMVYSLVSFIAFVVLFIVIPFEAQHKPEWMIISLIFVATYMVFSILYYYRKASTVPPGSPRKRHATPFCYRCQNHKPFNAHHCSICDMCVLNMDHHCIWINQCVGAQNHRYFLQFVGFLTVGCFIFPIVAFPTFYYNFWALASDTSFCGIHQLYVVPWRDYFCSNGMDFVSTSIFFSYALCSVVFFLVGGLFWWNVSLISSGQTYIDFLHHGPERSCFKQVFCPFTSENFGRNWKNFLGLRNGRTFARHILLPSNHVTYLQEEDLLELAIL